MNPSASEKVYDKKPGIPPLLLLSLCFYASVASIFSWSYIIPVDTLKIIGIASAIAVLTLLVFGSYRRFNIAILATIFSTLGIMFACVAAIDQLNESEMRIDDDIEWEIYLLSDESSTDMGSSCKARAVSPEGCSYRVKAFFDDRCSFAIDRMIEPNGSDPDSDGLEDRDATTESDSGRRGLLSGECISVSGTLKNIDGSERDRYWDDGITHKIYIDEYEFIHRNAFLESIIDARRRAIDLFSKYCREEAGTLQALVCGYKDTLSRSGEYDRYKTCGVAHVVAVSGAHLTIVIMMLGILLNALRLAKMVRVLISVMIIIIYLVFAGLPISAIRAALMTVMSLFSFVAKRRPASLNALGISLFAFILHDPTSAVSISLFLSAGSTLGIILFARMLSTRLYSGNNRAIESAVQPLSLTLSSNVITLPFSSALFSQLSLISPLANLVVGPLFSMGCLIGLIAVMLCFILPAFTSSFMMIAMICAVPLTFSVDLMSNIPFACIAIAFPVPTMILVSVMSSIAIWFFWDEMTLKRITILGLSLGILISMYVFVRPPFQNRICMLDVGQGDSILIESHGHSVLIDTGNQESKLRTALAEHRVTHLDAVLITHSDDDHMASLRSLASYVRIDHIYLSKYAIECSCEKCTGLVGDARDILGMDPEGLEVGNVIRLGELELNVVWPRTYVDEGGNADSLCIVGEFDIDSDDDPDCRALFCGDAEQDVLGSLIAEDNMDDIDILKVGHHGSKVAVNDEVLDALDPEVALISVGEKNRYGHPKEETLDLLDAHGVRIFRTDLCGCVDVDITGDGLKIHNDKSR